jgi:hypothetical protein
MQILRAIWAVAAAMVYKLATNPFALAAVLGLFGYWPTAAAVLVIHTAGCIGALVTAKPHVSPLTGQAIRSPVRGSAFWLWGNDQDGLWVGWHIEKYPKALRWLAPFMWTWWRNKYRNVPFVPLLDWLHKPKGQLVWREARIFGVLVIVVWRGWMTELRCSKGGWFLDVGPRLDQPEGWGGVSWAFRPFGRL